MTIERLERLRYAKDDEDYDGLSILGLEQEHDFTHYHDASPRFTSRQRTIGASRSGSKSVKKAIACSR